MKRGVAIGLVLAGCAATDRVPDPSYVTSDTASINTQLGVEYMKQGNYEVAIVKLKKALDDDPDYSGAYSVLGEVYRRTGQMAEAETYFRKAVDLDPKDSGAASNYGQFLCQAGRYAEADTMFEQALANPLYANPEIALANQGMCAGRKGDLGRAEEKLREALDRNPRLPAGLLEMADLSLRQGQYLKARGYLTRYAEVAKQTARSLWLGVRVERQLGDVDKAASYAVALKGRFPDSEEARLLTASERQPGEEAGR
jgi:type IV pilus assembly protein PilF